MTEKARVGVAVLAVALLVSLLWWLVPRQPTGDEIADTRAALQAWAKFASSGEIGSLAGRFVEDGPQYLQLLGEASSSRFDAGDDYRFELESAEILREGIVAGTVEVYRDGVVNSSHRWEIELHRSGDRWQIWTVRTLDLSVTD